MKTLHDNQDYYILIDGQGGSFGGGRILEGKNEVFDTFKLWAESDDFRREAVKKFTFRDCIEMWNIDIKKYNGRDFVELKEDELSIKQ